MSLEGMPDPAEPELFESAFPRDAFPVFEWTERPPDVPAVVWTTETTHRDGQQGGLPLTVENGIRIYELMCAFTGTSGAIRQAEFFVYRPADRQILEGALERYRDGAPIEPTTWIRASAKDAILVREIGVRETGMLASASDYHTFYKFTPGGRRNAANAYLDAVRAVLDAGLRPRLHLEDATRAAEEFVLPFAEVVREVASRYPDIEPPKFRICDTMGLGLPYESVGWPRSVPRLVRRMREAGIASEDLEFHPHNDTHLVVANCLAAIQAGCAAINGTLLGKGERTGNAPLEAILLHAEGMGCRDARPDFRVLNELAALYQEMGEPVPPKYPLYGGDAHRTRAGIHADGLNKFWWMYAPFDVPRLLGRPLELSLTRDSGIAGLIFLVKQHTGREPAKDDPELQRVHEELIRQFDAGRQTAVEWEEVRALLGETPANDLYLRDVVEEDLPIFFRQQLDEEANWMAAFAAKDPADRDAFMTKWKRILAGDRAKIKTIVFEGEVAGSVLCWTDDEFGKPEVSYWLGREYWGKGIATRALAEFLDHVTVRPIYGRTVKDNIGSRRVLEKCGFTHYGEDRGFANARGEEVEELILALG